MLTESEVVLLVFYNDRLYQYASTDIDRLLLRYTEDSSDPQESRSNPDFIHYLEKHGYTRGDDGDDDDDHDGDGGDDDDSDHHHQHQGDDHGDDHDGDQDQDQDLDDNEEEDHADGFTADSSRTVSPVKSSPVATSHFPAQQHHTHYQQHNRTAPSPLAGSSKVGGAGARRKVVKRRLIDCLLA